MSKPNCESKSPIYSTVLRQSVKYWEQRETGLLIFIADVWKNYLATLESGVSDSCSPTFIYKFENVDKKKMKKMTEMPRLM